MSIRRSILKELREFERANPGAALLSDGMKIFLSTPVEKRGDVVLALNQLLNEGLVLGVPGPSDPEGRGQQVAVKLNPAKLDLIDKELSLDWRYWLALFVAVLAVVAGFLAIK